MNKLKEVRKAKGLSQYQLGRAIGKYQTRIWQLESGYAEAGEEERERIASVLGVAVEEVFPPQEEAPAPVAEAIPEVPLGPRTMEKLIAFVRENEKRLIPPPGGSGVGSPGGRPECGPGKGEFNNLTKKGVEKMNYVKEWRKANGFSQKELARCIGTSQTRIWQIENGYAEATEEEMSLMGSVLENRVAPVFPFQEETPAPVAQGPEGGEGASAENPVEEGVTKEMISSAVATLDRLLSTEGKEAA